MRSLLDMGTASAFFTFISKRPRHLAFYTSYAIWHLIQFFLPFIIIAFILPQAWLEAIWVGQERNLVLLAFSALFFQQLLWPTINYIGESKRLTSRVQTLNISISTANLGIVCGAWFLGKLTVQVLFWILLLQYLIALVSALEILNVFDVKRESLDIRAMLGEYFDYCLPLVIFSVLGFAYEFADRWLLQSFGGSEEQAFYMVCLL